MTLWPAFFHIFSPFQLDHWIGFGTIYRNPLFFGGVFPWFPVHFPKKTHQPWMEHQTARRQKTSWHLLRSWAMPKGHQAWHGHPNGHAIARLQMNCGFQKMGILIFSKDWKVNRKDRTGDFLGHFFGRFWFFFSQLMKHIWYFSILFLRGHYGKDHDHDPNAQVTVLIWKSMFHHPRLERNKTICRFTI